MTEHEYAYIAGVLDSDGCIGIQKNLGGSNSCQPYIVVVQRDMILIEWLYSKLGCRVNLVSRKMAGRTDYYLRWEMSNKSVADLLERCVPYMVVKKEQAILAIELIRNRKAFGNMRGKPLTPETVSRQMEIYSRVRCLNSPETTERISSLKKEMRQSELAKMINRQRENRSILSAN